MKTIALTVCCLFLAIPAQAKVYKWVDENGKTHFTDRADKIPKKKRDKSEIIKGVKPLTNSHSKPPSARQVIKEHCVEKWETNYKMIQFCIKNQEKAYNEIQQNQNHWDTKISKSCTKKWETNYRMILFCLKRQEKAKRELGMR